MFPKIKRAGTVYLAEEGMPFEAYEEKTIETERMSRAEWAEALAKTIHDNPFVSNKIEAIYYELIKQAAADRGKR